MNMLALIASMSLESSHLLSSMTKVRSREIAGKIFSYGILKGKETVIVNTGIGRVNASHAATVAVENFPVRSVVNVGVGGAYAASGLETGDVAIASKEISGDEGVLDSKGWSSMKEIGIPLVESGNIKLFNEFPVTVPEVSGLLGGDAASSHQVKTGIFVTVSAATGSQKRANELYRRFGGICENMEGSALAHVCAVYEIPFMEVRGISNIVGVRDKRKWKLKLAAERAQHSVLLIAAHKTADKDGLWSGEVM